MDGRAGEPGGGGEERGGRLVRLAVRVDREHAEVALAELLELAPGGVEEVDVSDRVVEYAVYGAPGELPSLPSLEAAAGGALVQVSTSPVADDWASRWRSFHRPLVLGDRLTVRPPWEPFTGATALDVVIDPGQAFGTGAHPTTRLCLELLLAERPVGACADLGCGSGVLAITAALLGFAPVLALDNDPVAVSTAAVNAEVNGVGLDARLFDLRREQVPDVDLVVANVLAGPLLTWADVQERLPPRLILSGLLTGEADRVARAYESRGMRLVETRADGDWAALLLAPS